MRAAGSNFHKNQFSSISELLLSLPMEMAYNGACAVWRILMLTGERKAQSFCCRLTLGHFFCETPSLFTLDDVNDESHPETKVEQWEREYIWV
jgi:hypothetical protein